MKTFEGVLHKIIVGGIFIIPFIPLVVLNGISFPFITGKAFLFRVVVEIIFAAWLVLLIRNPEYRPKRSPILLSFLAFVGVMAIATVLSEDPYRSFWSNYERMEGYISLLHFLGYFLVIGSVFKTGRIWKNFWYTSLGVSFFLVLFAFTQYAGELPINQGGIRVDATFGNAIYFAVYLLFHIFITALLFFKTRMEKQYMPVIWSYALGSLLFILFYLYHISDPEKGARMFGVIFSVLSALIIAGALYLRKQRLGEKVLQYIHIALHVILVVLSGIVVFLNATRGTALGLLVGGFVMVVLILWHYPKYKKYIAALFILGLLGVGGFIAIRNTPYVQEHKILSRFANISSENEDIKVRFRVWNIAWQGVKERPIFGWGQENFNYVFNKYYDTRLYNREPWFDRTHNIIFDTLVTGGLIGLLSYLALFGSGVYMTLRSKKEGNQLITFSPIERSVLTGLFVAYGVHNLLAFDNLISFVFFLSVLAYLNQSVVPEQKKESARVSSKFFPWAVTGVTIVIIFTLYEVNIRPIAASGYLIKAIHQQEGGLLKNYHYFVQSINMETFGTPEAREQLVQAASNFANADIDQPTKDKFFNLALSEMEKQVKISPHNARYPLFIGSLYGEYRQYEKAIEWYKKGLEFNPNKQQILYQIGTSYLNLRREQEALPYFKEALDLAPENHEAKLIYLVGALYAKDTTLAEQLYSELKINNHHVDERITRAYFAAGNYSRVIEIWRDGIASNPTNALYHLHLAGALLQDGQVAEAIAMIRRAGELNPDYRAQADGYLKEIQKIYPNFF